MEDDANPTRKDRLVIGMIDYMEVVNETFETSHLVEKAEDILLISYLWEPETDPLDYRIELVEKIDLKGLPEGDLAQIRDDWETVVDKVRDGRAHEISGSDTLYLEACTKAANSTVRRRQPFSDIVAKPRARTLKASFMTTMSNRPIENMHAIGRRLRIVEGRLAILLGHVWAALATATTGHLRYAQPRCVRNKAPTHGSRLERLRYQERHVEKEAPWDCSTPHG